MRLVEHPVQVRGERERAGEQADGEYLIPMATTEGTLIASYKRGAKVLNLCGGVKVTVQADAKQLLLCCYLSGTVLLGLLANSAFGWWWADSAAGLVMAPLIVKEGLGAWRGETCCENCG